MRGRRRGIERLGSSPAPDRCCVTLGEGLDSSPRKAGVFRVPAPQPGATGLDCESPHSTGVWCTRLSGAGTVNTTGRSRGQPQAGTEWAPQDAWDTPGPSPAQRVADRARAASVRLVSQFPRSVRVAAALMRPHGGRGRPILQGDQRGSHQNQPLPKPLISSQAGQAGEAGTGQPPPPHRHTGPLTLPQQDVGGRGSSRPLPRPPLSVGFLSRRISFRAHDFLSHPEVCPAGSCQTRPPFHPAEPNKQMKRTRQRAFQCAPGARSHQFANQEREKAPADREGRG